MEKPRAWIGVKWIMLKPDLAATSSLSFHVVIGPSSLERYVWHAMESRGTELESQERRGGTCVFLKSLVLYDKS